MKKTSNSKKFILLISVILFLTGIGYFAYTINNSDLNIEFSEASDTDRSPKGHADTVTCEVVKGWACDPDDYTKNLEIHIYRGSTSTAEFVGKAIANMKGEDAIGVECGGAGNSNKRFEFRVPKELIDGTDGRQFWAHAINVGDGDNKLLTGSPLKLDTSKCDVEGAKSSPLGFADKVSCDKLYGWTCDPDDFTKDLEVKIYRGVEPNGTLLGTVTANLNGGEAIGNYCGGNKNKRFEFPIPKELIDGTDGRQFWAHATNIGSKGSDTILPLSPQILNTTQCGVVKCSNYEECFKLCAAGDINCDKTITIKDFVFFASSLARSRETGFEFKISTEFLSDMNQDTKIDIQDFLLFKEEYLKANQ